MDCSSRSVKTCSSVDDELYTRIERLRRSRMPMRTIAHVVGCSVATISRVLATLGLPSLKALAPKRPVVRYERSVPGEMLHRDSKKLGRIARSRLRVTGDRHDWVDGASWEVAHVSIDDHSRVGCVQMHVDEKMITAVEFLKAA